MTTVRIMSDMTNTSEFMHAARILHVYGKPKAARRLMSVTCLLIVLLTIATEGHTDPKDNLEPVPAAEFREFLIANRFTLPLSHKIFINDIQFDFADIWLERFTNETSSHYRDIIARDYSQCLKIQLEQALSKLNWRIVNKPEEDALRLNAHLLDVYIFSPETVAQKDTIMTLAGQAGIELAFQTPKGKTFMKLTDHRNTRNNNSGMLANRASNYHYFEMLMSDWANAAISYLGKVTTLAEQSRQ